MIREIKTEAKAIYSQHRGSLIELFLIYAIIHFIFLAAFWEIANLTLTNQAIQSYFSGNLPLLLLAPLEMGMIKLLIECRNGNKINISNLFIFYEDKKLLVKSIMLILLTTILLNTINSGVKFLFPYQTAPSSALANYTVASYYQNALNLLINLLPLILTSILSLYFFLINYLFVYNPQKRIMEIIKQSFNSMRGNVFALILFGLSFTLWFALVAIALIAVSVIIPSINNNHHIVLQNTILLKNITYFSGQIVISIFSIFFYPYFFTSKLIFADHILNPDSHWNNVEGYGEENEVYYFDGDIDPVGFDLAPALPEIMYSPQYALEARNMELFENEELIESNHFHLDFETGNLDRFDTDMVIDKMGMFYFLKDYQFIRKFFKKIYKNAVNIVNANRMETSQLKSGQFVDSLEYSNNDFKLSVTISDLNDHRKYSITFDFFINEKKLKSENIDASGEQVADDTGFYTTDNIASISTADEARNLALFENEDVMQSKHIELHLETDELDYFNTNKAVKKINIYHFLKGYPFMKKLFRTVYQTAVEDFDSFKTEESVTRTGQFEDFIEYNQNKFRLIVNIIEIGVSKKYKIDFDLFINE